MSSSHEGIVSFTIPMLIKNSGDRYDGNLISYFRAVFSHATNLQNPYHNFRHMLYVVCRCYEACIYYGEALSRRAVRDLLIAAMFHDFDHSGKMVNDEINIEMAILGFRKYLAQEDKDSQARIEELISCTEYPYKVSSRKMDLSCQILRDADLSQALNVAWIQQVIFGLAKEWNKSPQEVLKMQAGFHQNLGFATEWARKRFPLSMVVAKIQEAEDLLGILEC